MLLVMAPCMGFCFFVEIRFFDFNRCFICNYLRMLFNIILLCACVLNSVSENKSYTRYGYTNSAVNIITGQKQWTNGGQNAIFFTPNSPEILILCGLTRLLFQHVPYAGTYPPAELF